MTREYVEPDYGYPDYPAGQGTWLQRARYRMATLVGAALATAVMVALGMWFYHLGVRDAQSVPVIKAEASPVKERPEDRGGEVTPYQDVRSYNLASASTVTVDATEAAAPVTAPPPPEPAAEDLALAALTPQPRQAPREAIQPAPAVQQTTVQQTALVAEPEEPAATESETPAETEIAALTPAIVEEPEPAAPAGQGTELAPVSSPRFNPRPADLRDRMVAARQAEENAGETLSKRAEASKVKVQLRASPIREEIVNSWSRIQGANRDLLGEKALIVQQTTSGGTIFYRMRVGPFRDRSEASALCQALQARGQDCIVATNG